MMRKFIRTVTSFPLASHPCRAYHGAMRGIDATLRRTRAPEIKAVRLRVEVFEELTARKNATTVQARAELLNLNRDTVRRLRGGSYEPTLGTAMHIARVLGTKVEKLWGPASEVCSSGEAA